MEVYRARVAAEARREAQGLEQLRERASSGRAEQCPKLVAHGSCLLVPGSPAALHLLTAHQLHLLASAHSPAQPRSP